MEFEEILNKRYSTKSFSSKKISDGDIEKLKEYIKLAPTSFGLQPFKVIFISDKKIKERLLSASWNQPQISSCSHLIVFCAMKNPEERINGYSNLMKEASIPHERIDSYKEIMKGSISRFNDHEKVNWSAKQAYLAAMNAVNGAIDLGFESSPMEGFVPSEYSKILGLDDDLVPSVLVAIGYANDKKGKRLRFSNEDIFEDR